MSIQKLANRHLSHRISFSLVTAVQLECQRMAFVTHGLNLHSGKTPTKLNGNLSYSSDSENAYTCAELQA